VAYISDDLAVDVVASYLSAYIPSCSWNRDKGTRNSCHECSRGVPGLLGTRKPWDSLDICGFFLLVRGFVGGASTHLEFRRFGNSGDIDGRLKIRTWDVEAGVSMYCWAFGVDAVMKYRCGCVPWALSMVPVGLYLKSWFSVV